MRRKCQQILGRGGKNCLQYVLVWKEEGYRCEKGGLEPKWVRDFEDFEEDEENVFAVDLMF